MEQSISYQQGRVNLQAQCLWAGDDLLLLISGGDVPHIGAICMAQADGQVQTMSYSGHREDELAQQMARTIALALERKVVVAAGMHWREFSAELLAEIENAWQELAKRLVLRLKK